MQGPKRRQIVACLCGKWNFVRIFLQRIWCELNCSQFDDSDAWSVQRLDDSQFRGTTTIWFTFGQWTDVSAGGHIFHVDLFFWRDIWEFNCAVFDSTIWKQKCDNGECDSTNCELMHDAVASCFRKNNLKKHNFLSWSICSSSMQEIHIICTRQVLWAAQLGRGRQLRWQYSCLKYQIPSECNERGNLICEVTVDRFSILPRFRGSLISVYDTAYNIGAVIAFVLAMYCDMMNQAKYLLIMVFVFVALFLQIPKTPQYFIERNAAQVITHSTSHKLPINVDFSIFSRRQTKRRSSSKERNWKSYHWMKRGNKTITRHWHWVISVRRNRPGFFWFLVLIHNSRIIPANPRARRAISISFSLVSLYALQGTAVLSRYITEIFTNTTDTTVSPLFASVMSTVVFIVANLIYMNVVDRINRRTLYISSAVATAVGLTLFAIYLYFLAENPSFGWMPVVCVSLTLFVNCIGMYPVAWLIIIEILPKKVIPSNLAIHFTRELTFVLVSFDAAATLRLLRLHNADDDQRLCIHWNLSAAQTPNRTIWMDCDIRCNDIWQRGLWIFLHPGDARENTWSYNGISG